MSSDLVQTIEARMLSGEPFTYGAMCEWAGQRGNNEPRMRTVDKTIQRLRRKGLIAFERKGRDTVWTVVPPTPKNGTEQP